MSSQDFIALLRGSPKSTVSGKSTEMTPWLEMHLVASRKDVLVISTSNIRPPNPPRDRWPHPLSAMQSIILVFIVCGHCPSKRKAEPVVFGWLFAADGRGGSPSSLSSLTHAIHLAERSPQRWQLEYPLCFSNRLRRVSVLLLSLSGHAVP